MQDAAAPQGASVSCPSSPCGGSAGKSDSVQEVIPEVFARQHPDQSGSISITSAHEIRLILLSGRRCRSGTALTVCRVVEASSLPLAVSCLLRFTHSLDQRINPGVRAPKTIHCNFASGQPRSSSLKPSRLP